MQYCSLRVFLLEHFFCCHYITDPDITIPILWPRGTYSLIQVADQACNPGWLTSCRYRDTENTGPSNTWTDNIQSYIQGEFLKSSIKLCYCTKAQDDSSIFRWSKGTYCIAQKGGTCPDPAFSQGYMYWDDENEGNSNYVENADGLPDGSYDENTRINYCCRNDGSSSDTIVLPSERDFVLLSPVEECQQVEAMSVKMLEINYDDEDDDNKNNCSPEFTHPLNCIYWCNHSPNYSLFPCYYTAPQSPP